MSLRCRALVTCHSIPPASGSRLPYGQSKSREGRAMRRSVVMVAALAAAATLAAGFASSAGAYGGGASHDTWQIGISGNCNNPASSFCQNPETGSPELGGFWGWVEFDRFADGTITGDEQVTGCEHGIGGAGSFGAEHADVDITSAHLVAAGPGDPDFWTPGAQGFFLDSNVGNREPQGFQFFG